MARDQKGALAEQRTIVYVDLAAFSLLPGVVRTYAPRGQTPILRAPKSYDNLAQLAIAMQRPECISENRRLESWLPGGDAVLVTTGDELQEQDLSGQIKVLVTGRWDRPRATSDGLHILAILLDLQLRSSTFWRIDRATGQRQEIVLPGYDVAEAVESPDGRYIVFSQNAVLDTGDCLYLLDLQQPTAQPVCLVQGYRILAWAP